VDTLPENAVSELVYRIAEDDVLRADLTTVRPELPGLATPLARGLLNRTASRALVESHRDR
jgi:hypothetical protein